MARKQSAADRQQRLDSGRCPVHGNSLSQVDHWYEERDWRKRRTYGRHYTLTHDGRGDCPIIVKSYGVNGPWELPHEWQHILLGEQEGELEPRGKPEQHLNVVEGLHSSEFELIGMPQPYAMHIDWSANEGTYLVSLPDWATYVKQPVARGATYAEAAYEAMFVIHGLIQEVEAHGKEPPMPRNQRTV